MKEKLKQRKTLFIVISIILVILIIAGVTTAILTNKNQNGTKVAKSETNTTTNTIVGQVSTTNADNDEGLDAIIEHDASGDKVYVPEGYVGSQATGENEIDTGYVIYEGTEPVTNSNVATAKKTRNQYVWVPVPDITKFYGTDSNKKRCGKLYNFATSSTTANYDEVTGAYPKNWSESDGVMRITSSTSYREPDVVPKSGSTAYDMDSRLKTLGLGAETTQEFLMQLEQEFNNMIKSVEKYGGFYIGRYETGDLNQNTAVVKQGNTNISSQTWYTMYKKCKTLKGSNNNVETSMIWGNQWDRTLMWLVESGNKTKEEIASDSTSWGNYNNATFEYTNTSGSTSTKNQKSSTRIPSGSTEYTKANNIYDLAGNVSDWTMEAYSNSGGRVSRGGVFNVSGSVVPASNRYNNAPTSSYSNYGCRATLYIK